ncbi:hypothetical protein AYO44_05730 [Planctomycetaceae bacterium SCGC AG-212-F19]|nr:hypothetical protein AYO44_05730 [Planctomycetaceae bacterium SCGC AG-212-F19]
MTRAVYKVVLGLVLVPVLFLTTGCQRKPAASVAVTPRENEKIVVVDQPAGAVAKQPPAEVTKNPPQGAESPKPGALDRDRPSFLDSGRNLLRLPSAKLEVATAPAAEWVGLKAIVDGDPLTVGVGSAAPEAPLDIVFGFGGATVTAERLVVVQPLQPPPGAATERVEILVSTVSPHFGFRSVRADVLKPQVRVQEFGFLPVGARWIMVRLTPAEKATRVALAEVAILGREGPPVSNYAFNEAPAKAIDLLARLKKISTLNITVTPDESALFEDAKDGQLNKWSFAEAALLACGVQDAAKRKAYLAQLDVLEIEARKSLQGAKTPEEKGRKLLQWLHAGPLAKGYVSGQTDVSVILDTKTYNCVSSATLYNILGRRLGLDLRAIEVPDHTFAIFYEGTKHADVETTTSSGFNPARDPAAQKEFEKKTNFVYIPDSHRDQRRELRETGLVAITYYNHGVELTRAKRYHEALLAYFRALSLDPEFPSAIKNALAVLANWSAELADKGKFEEALQILDTGLDLAPRDASLRHNRKAVWTEWALKSGADDDALAILTRAAREVPDEAGHFRSMQVYLFIRKGEERIGAKRWEEALAATEGGLQKLDETLRPELRKWRAEVYLRWAQAAMENRQFEAALAVLDKGRSAEPLDKRYANNIAYVVQEWVRHVNQENPDKAKAVLVAVLKRYEAIPEVKRGAWGFVHRVVKDQCDADNFDVAFSFIAAHADLLNDKSESKQLILAVFDAQASRSIKRKDFAAALEAYLKALERYPDDSHPKNGFQYVVQEWVKHESTLNGNDQGLALLAKLMTKHGKLLDARDATGYVHQMLDKRIKVGDFMEALAELDRNRDLLKDKATLQELYVSLYDGWARKLTEVKDWEGAIGVFERGLERFPKDSHLQNNLVVAVQNGSWEIYQRLGEDPAKEFLAAMLKRFPDRRDVHGRVSYHVQRLADQLLELEKPAEAEAVIDRHAHLLVDAKAGRELYVRVYQRSAAKCLKDRNWEGAATIWHKGLKRFPDESDFKSMLAAGVQDAAWDIYGKEGEEPARQFFGRMQERFPKSPEVPDRLSYHVARVASKFQEAGKFEEAVAAVDRHKGLLKDDFEKQSAAVYDRWARTYFKKDWAAAIAVYEKGLERFPSNSLLKNNVDYCREQKKK